MRNDKLSILIDRALDALSVDRKRVRLTVSSEAGRTLVKLHGLQLGFGPFERSRTLAWERLVDALPLAVERVRLETMHRATGEQWAALWSVYAPATVIAWLAQSSGGSDTSRWREDQLAILRAGEVDGSVVLRSHIDSAAVLTGRLRSRQLLATIRFGQDLTYSSVERTITARDAVPHIVADASANKNLADIVEMPWVRDANVLIDTATIGPTGTTINLREALFPLVPIPQAAHSAVPAGGPGYAPWIVTATERDALDAIDAEAHLLI